VSRKRCGKWWGPWTWQGCFLRWCFGGWGM